MVTVNSLSFLWVWQGLYLLDRQRGPKSNFLLSMSPKGLLSVPSCQSWTLNSGCPDMMHIDKLGSYESFRLTFHLALLFKKTHLASHCIQLLAKFISYKHKLAWSLSGAAKCWARSWVIWLVSSFTWLAEREGVQIRGLGPQLETLIPRQLWQTETEPGVGTQVQWESCVCWEPSRSLLIYLFHYMR